MKLRIPLFAALTVLAWFFSGPAIAQNVRSQTQNTQTLLFRGVIDGSNTIRITADAATWTLVDGGFPSKPSTLNGVSWNPGQMPVLLNRGATTFLRSGVDFSHAQLEVQQARDTVVMERTADAVVIHLDDTLSGEAEYRFRLIFPPKPQPAVLHITAMIDGSDELHIFRDHAWWVHKQWGWPPQVSLNGVLWHPQSSPVLFNTGSTAFLTNPVDFSTAKLVKQRARDMVVLVSGQDGAVVSFADDPNGAALYDVTVVFGL